MNQVRELLIIACLQSRDDRRTAFAAVSVSTMARGASADILLLTRLRESGVRSEERHKECEDTHLHMNTIAP